MYVGVSSFCINSNFLSTVAATTIASGCSFHSKYGPDEWLRSRLKMVSNGVVCWGVMSGLDGVDCSFTRSFCQELIGQLGSKDLGGNEVIYHFQGGVSPYPQTLFVTGS